MAVIVDNLITYRILSMLVTPFAETDAYKLGIIDAEGNNLIKSSKFTTSEQKDAYTYLHRLVFNMKKILSKLPGTESKIKSLVAALFLVKEYHENKDKLYNLMEDRFNAILKSNAILVEETVCVKKFIQQKELEEDVPTNSTGAAVSTDQPVAKKKDIDKYKFNNSNFLKIVRRK